ncbi:MAG: PIN domain-containing protein [Actinomycetota bacterium]|nr:PIN domain-containing protein [Actinomycetota bacterium]
MSGDKVFVDTNVLVYAYDIDAGHKHQVALGIMKDLWLSKLGILSTQTLQEFFVIVTGKIPFPLEVGVAKDIIEKLSKWDVILNDMEMVFLAIEFHQRHQLSFWDSLIIASAAQSGAKTILTEDISDGQTINGVTIKNPFMLA